MTPVTDDQRRAVENCTPFFSEPANGTIRLISGYAGTGKTSIIAFMMEAGIITGRTVMSAPTHKAVRVLRSKMKGLNTDFSTIHALLAVKPVTDDDGTRTFRSTTRMSKLPIHSYDNIIVDEASMLEDELMDILVSSKHLRSRLLLSGDGFQLPPVDHEPGVKAIPFRCPERYSIQTDILDEIVRQKNGNSIIPFATEIRGMRVPGPEGYGKNIRPKSRSEMGSYALKLFKSDEYRSDRDRLRYLGYTNRAVDSFNASVHSILYPQTSIVSPGEVIILRAPYPINSEFVLQNNEELEILGVEPIRWKAEYRYDVLHIISEPDVLLCTVRDADGIETSIMIATNQPRWDDTLDKISNRIRYTRIPDKRKAWRAYYDLKDQIATWKHSYAQTIHTAQGSTFYETAIDMADVRICKTAEYWNLLYTGVTRSSDILTLV